MGTVEPADELRRADEVWARIHDERRALAADLAGLDEGQWGTASLCAGFSARDVLAHLTSGASLNGVRWMVGVIRCRFDFDKQVAMRLAEQLADTLARFRRVVDGTTKPPLPVVAMLGESVVHAEDIRRPLGIRRDYPADVLVRLATYYHGSDQVVPARKRVRDLRLSATDTSFSAGSGPLVSGTTLALIMAMTGRTAYCDDLHGDGVDRLRERCPQP